MSQLNRENIEILDTINDGRCLFAAMLFAFAQQFTNVEISVEACDRLRAEVALAMMEMVQTDDLLQEQLCLHRRERRAFNQQWTQRQNAEEEIVHIQKPKTWGGLECISVFCKMFCVQVLLLLPTTSFRIGEVGEELLIYFNGHNHFSGVSVEPSRAARQAESRSRTNQPENAQAVQQRVDRHRKRKAEEKRIIAKHPRQK